MELPGANNNAVDLDGVLPILVKSAEVRNLLASRFGAKRADVALSMMRAGKLEGDFGTEIYDLFSNEINAEARYVWTGTVRNDVTAVTEPYEVFIHEYEGVFFVSVGISNECGPYGYFRNIEAAKEFIDHNWGGDVVADEQ